MCLTELEKRQVERYHLKHHIAAPLNEATLDIYYFMTQISFIQFKTKCQLPSQLANFELNVFLEPSKGKEHLALVIGSIGEETPVLLRMHSECMTGDTLFSQRCDCRPQLEKSLKIIGEAGRGILLYLRQEGRGIGLVNKIKAYALQDQGLDTVEANLHMGFMDDQRSHSFCKEILDYFGVKKVGLLSNNPRKIDALTAMGYDVERRALQTPNNEYNRFYLSTKVKKLGHFSDFENLLN